MTTHDHDFKPGGWPFDDPENVAAICCRHVLDGKEILRVMHDDDDGSWQILCGSPHVQEDARVVCLGCMVKRDETLLELAGLPLGWCADRDNRHSPWECTISSPAPSDDNVANPTLNTDRPTAALLGSLRAARSGGRLAPR